MTGEDLDFTLAAMAVEQERAVHRMFARHALVVDLDVADQPDGARRRTLALLQPGADLGDAYPHHVDALVQVRQLVARRHHRRAVASLRHRRARVAFGTDRGDVDEVVGEQLEPLFVTTGIKQRSLAVEELRQLADQLDGRSGAHDWMRFVDAGSSSHVSATNRSRQRR